MRSIFITLSESKRIRHLAEQSRLGRRLSSRFVAGMEVEDALRATREVNALGMSVSVDNLGENVTNLDEAHESAQLYHQMLDRIDQEKLDSNVSLKLTHMGLDVDPQLARRITDELVAHAVRLNNFVRIDMEGSDYTQITIDLTRELHRRPGHRGHVGTVLQSYLHRTHRDAEELCGEGIRIRLCKGAYKEPKEIAYQAKSEVDANFVKVMKTLLNSGVYHGIATHDPAMIDATIEFAKAEKIPSDAFEFQMLYGVRRDLQEKLVADGWRMRVYIPFGREWYPYFMRRLAERPANVLFVAKSLFYR